MRFTIRQSFKGGPGGIKCPCCAYKQGSRARRARALALAKRSARWAINQMLGLQGE